MHIIIGFLTAVTGLLWALHRMGVDLGGLNPFDWKRRRTWRKRYETKPLHQLQRPIEAATVLLVAMVSVEGLVSREQKEALQGIFREEFNKSAAEAADMFGSGVFLLKDSADIVHEVPFILEPNREAFTESQINTLLKLLDQVAHLEGEVTPMQKDIIAAVEKELVGNRVRAGEW